MLDADATGPLWLNTSNQGAVRTFSTLDETSNEGRANYQLTFPWRERQHSIKVGGLYRATDRDADSRSYSISAAGAPVSLRLLAAEQLFDGRFTQGAEQVFDIAPFDVCGRPDESGKTVQLWARTPEGHVAMDAVATLA